MSTGSVRFLLAAAMRLPGESIERLADGLISGLDVTDGDPDLEPDDEDHEPDGREEEGHE